MSTYPVEFSRLEKENKWLRAENDIYKTQFTAAMRATSLGLCKKAISHALEHSKAQKGE